jgi:RNA polymerase sigma-70 factor (ECF subfamily)
MRNAMLARVTMRPTRSNEGATEVDSQVERLFRAEAGNLWRAVLVFAGGRRDIADDAVAEAFARAIVYEGRIRRPVGWLYQVAFRLAAEQLRRERRMNVAEPAVPVESPEVIGVLEALRRLSPRQRVAVVLFHEVDLPVSEIARRMGISSATVRVHLHRGRRRLRELLDEGGG